MREEVGHRYAPASRIFYFIDLWPQHCAGLLIMFSLLQSKLITLNEIYPKDEVIEYINNSWKKSKIYIYVYIYIYIYIFIYIYVYIYTHIQIHI